MRCAVPSRVQDGVPITGRLRSAFKTIKCLQPNQLKALPQLQDTFLVARGLVPFRQGGEPESYSQWRLRSVPAAQRLKAPHAITQNAVVVIQPRPPCLQTPTTRPRRSSSRAEGIFSNNWRILGQDASGGRYRGGLASRWVGGRRRSGRGSRGGEAWTTSCPVRRSASRRWARKRTPRAAMPAALFKWQQSDSARQPLRDKARRRHDARPRSRPCRPRQNWRRRC